MAKEMEEKFGRICQYIENGDKVGMLEYIKTHKIKPKDYNEDFCYDYPIDRAATFGQLDIFNALVELGYSVDGIEIHPIYQASMDGYLDLVRALVEVHGVNPSTPDPYGSTAMTCAVNEMHLDVVKYLISAGVSVNARISDIDHGNIADATYKNITILHHAVVNEESSDICKYLISVGADIEASDAEGNTPLHKAAEELHTNIIQILLDAGAVIDARNSAGETPFLVAAKAINENPWNGNGAVKVLYKSGADPRAKDSSGKSPLNYAMNSYKQAYFLLVEVNLTPSSLSDVRELLSLALKAECKHTLNLLVTLGYDSWLIDVIYDEIDSSWEEGQEVMKNLRDISTKPRSLADLCCFKIRRLLDTRLSKVLDFLPVVENVKEFLRLSHIPKKMDDEEEGDEDDEEDEEGEEEVDDGGEDDEHGSDDVGDDDDDGDNDDDD